MKKLLLLSITVFLTINVWGQTQLEPSPIWYKDNKVGIGIASPSASLDILGGGSHLARFYYYDGSSNPRLSVWGYSNKINLRTTHSTGGADLSFGTSDAHDALIIKQSGNIGIGTFQPSTLLESAGAITINPIHAGNNYLMFKTNNERLGIIGSDQCISGNNSKNLGIYVYGANDLEFWTNSTKRLIIDSKGNIAIGTTTIPYGYKLAVDGKVICEEVKVEMIDGADFVFEEDYELRNLNEVEDFIKTNKHLPEIASTKEMEENGVDMGEFQIQLLQKIEELSLYVIEQQKEIEELKKLIK